MGLAPRLIADSLIAVAFAPRCAGCQAVLETPTRGAVCAACWLQVRALPPQPAGPGALAAWRGAAGEYDGPLRQISTP